VDGAAAWTTVVGADVALGVLTPFVAVTTTRIVRPTSLEDSLYVEVADALVVRKVLQLLPALSQSCQL
jgi:hypothetical protein